MCCYGQTDNHFLLHLFLLTYSSCFPQTYLQNHSNTSLSHLTSADALGHVYLQPCSLTEVEHSEFWTHPQQCGLTNYFPASLHLQPFSMLILMIPVSSVIVTLLTPPLTKLKNNSYTLSLALFLIYGNCPVHASFGCLRTLFPESLDLFYSSCFRYFNREGVA